LVLSPSLSPSAAASDGPNTVHVVVCGQNDVTVQAGEEVLLQYKRPYFADTEVCRCRACAAKKSKVDDGNGTTIYTNERPTRTMITGGRLFADK